MWSNLNVKMGRLIVGICLGSVLLTGCSSLGTYNPATGRNEFVLISTYDEVSMGQGVHHKLLSQYKLSDDPVLNTRLQKIGYQMANVSDRQDYQYKFYLVEDDQLNAFTTPGGNIYVFTGLIEKLDDEQLASVLAHEIGHCAAKHTAKKYQAAVSYSLIGSIVLGQIADDQARQLASLSTGAIMNLVSSSYSRKDEFEADRLAVKYMNNAGKDPKAVVEAFKVLKANSSKSYTPLILRSHPYLDDRISAVQKKIGKAHP